ncbi:MAG: AIPR family protein [Syntrophales bacterium]
MINDRLIDQAHSDLRSTCGGVREDYFGLLYLEQEHKVPREKAKNQVAFSGNDYGIDAFHFDEQRRNLYLFQFKYSHSYNQFKGSLQRLIADGVERIFVSPNKDDAKNQVLLQLRSCLIENRAMIDQICFRFVFIGDPEEAERSGMLGSLREDLENKKYLIDQFFGERKVGFVVEFRSSNGQVGVVSDERQTTTFDVLLTDLVVVDGPAGEKMYLGFIRLLDLDHMFRDLGQRFFEKNIRYGLPANETVNQAIYKTLKLIVFDQSESPGVFVFNHNGITLYVERVDILDGLCRLYAPRLLNGAQTVTTVADFLHGKRNKDHPKLETGKVAFESIRVLCKIITDADQKFVTRVTINNNRQNPVEPWNLHANDLIQIELQDKFRSDLDGLFYERQESAFGQLLPEDLDAYGFKQHSRAIQMLKLTQTFLLTDGLLSKVSNMHSVFEEDKQYDQVFRQGRLSADSRHILLCYKIQFNLRKYAQEIEQKGQSKYWFISRARNLLWALLCQGLLNHDDLETFAEKHGNTLTVAVDYKEHLVWLATARVRLLLSDLMKDPDYSQKVAEENLSFLRTDRAFEKCMKMAHTKWCWVQKKLG